jgi:hypothetical protein
MILQSQSSLKGITPSDISGCVFYLSFDTITNGSYIVDPISGRIGSLLGSPLPEQVDGRYNKCLAFPGGSGGVSSPIIYYLLGSPHPGNLNPNGDITVSLWMKPHAFIHADAASFFSMWSYSFWCKKTSSNNNLGVNFNSYSGANPGSHGDRGFTLQTPRDEWSHVVLVKPSWDYNNGSALGYVNGSLIASKSWCGSIYGAFTNNLMIGAHNSYPQFQYLAVSGLIDEVAIFDRVLEIDEIKQLYTGGYHYNHFCDIKHTW